CTVSGLSDLFSISRLPCVSSLAITVTSIEPASMASNKSTRSAVGSNVGFVIVRFFDDFSAALTTDKPSANATTRLNRERFRRWRTVNRLIDSPFFGRELRIEASIDALGRPLNLIAR